MKIKFGSSKSKLDTLNTEDVLHGYSKGGSRNAKSEWTKWSKSDEKIGSPHRLGGHHLISGGGGGGVGWCATNTELPPPPLDIE